MAEAEDPANKEYRQLRFRRPPGACEMLLVRHGESLPARADVSFPVKDGHSDPPLDPVGHRQAELVADRLVASGERFAAIYVSPLQRTSQTAAPLADRLGMPPVIVDDLREVHLGDWEAEGSYRKHVAEGHPLARQMGIEQRYDVLPGAEPGDVFADRVRGAFDQLAKAHPDEVIVVVCHGGVIGQILSMATGSRGLAFAGSDNASISHLVVSPGGRLAVRRYNDTGHLGPLFTEGPEPLT